MNCNQCLEKCKAVCCGLVPFEKKFYKKHKFAREIIRENDLGKLVVFETKDLRCPYLSAQFTCTIYKERPEICKLFGNETHSFLTCSYQDKNGRIRSRQERRNLERITNKLMDKKLKL